MSGKRLKIFNPVGGFSEQQLSKDTTFLTLAKVNSTNIMLAVAPITGVDIKQVADFSLTKSLDNDFLVTAFGDNPVQIELRGINIFNLNGCTLSGDKAAKDQIMNFYDKNKVSTDLEARFDLAVASSADTQTPVFRCVIVALRVSNNGQHGNVPTGNLLYDYNMTLIGARRA